MSKKHNESFNEEKEETSKDEEIMLDFSKIKGFFARKKKVVTQKHEKNVSPVTESKKEDEEIQVDVKAIGNFFKKYGVFFLILIPIILSSFFRAYPVYLPATDSWAEESVNRYFQTQIAVTINQQYPNLPEANRQALIQKEIEKIYQTKGDDIEKEIESTSQYFKSRMQDENGNTYLLAIDPYLWFSLARNYIRDSSTGLGDSVNEKGDHVFSLRNGRMDKGTTPLKFVTAFEIMLYKVVSFFNNDASLMKVIFFVPLILIGIAIIPAFFIARRIAGNIAGLFAGIIIAINSALLSRTPAGFSDTDAYNIIFPLFIVWTFMIAIGAKDIKKTAIFGMVTGFLFGLYSISWLGWGHLLIILIATLGVSFFYYLGVNRKELLEKGFGHILKIDSLKYNIVTGISFFVSSVIFISLFRGFQTFVNAGFSSVISFTTLKEVAVTTLWPNVLTTVAEFNEVNLSNIISQMGGILFFLIALMGISFAFLYKSKNSIKDTSVFIGSSIVWYFIVIQLLLKQSVTILPLMILLSIPFIFQYIISIIKQRKRFTIEYAALLLIWFIATLYSFTKGTRFAILLTPSFAICFGIAIGVMFLFLVKLFHKEFKIDQTITKIVLIVIFCLIIINPIKSAHSIAKGEIPSMNDAWYESLTGIRDASEDAIITSWWDFGHWFYAISERRVTFDGANQGRRIHWVGKTLLEDEEDLAVGMLRMLNCGQEESFKVFNKNFNHLKEYDPSEPNTVGTIILMDEVMKENDRENAKKILLREGFSGKEAEETLDYTHCENLIDQYFIASDDMIGKSGVWAHFGSWDFEKALTWQTINKINSPEEGISKLMDNFGVEDRTEAENMYYEIRSTKADKWVSEWPGYASGIQGCTKEGSTLKCTTGLIVDLDTYDAKITTKDGSVHVTSLVYPEGDKIITKSFEDKEDVYPISAVLIPKDNGEYNNILTVPEIASSLFTKLFFLEGHGLKHFKLFSYKQSVTGNQIYVYKVEWEPGNPNIMNVLIPSEEDIIVNSSEEAEEKEEEIRASHILVNSSEEAEEIIGLLNDGTDFSDLAKERSSCSSSTSGGDLGWFGKGRMVKEFEDAVFALEKGEITQNPVKTQFGYHIITVTGKRGGINDFKEEKAAQENTIDSTLTNLSDDENKDYSSDRNTEPDNKTEESNLSAIFNIS